MDPIEAFAQSIVRDYLREKGFTDTLECLTTEMQTDLQIFFADQFDALAAVLRCPNL